MPHPARNFSLPRLLSSRTFLIANLLLLGLLFFSFGREFARNYTIQQEIAELESEKTSLEAKNSEITSLMSAVQTETFIEREARIKLGLSKPGEKVIIVPGSATTNQAGSEQISETDYLSEIPVTDLSSVANSLKWWYYFFDINKFDMIKIYGNRQ